MFAQDKTVIYNQKDALKISNLNNSIIFTGLKNRGLYRVQNNEKLQIIPSSKTIVNIYKNDGKLNIKTNEGFYLYNGKTLNKVDNEKLLVKQMEKNIYIKKDNSWLKINPNNNDSYYAPRVKNDLILFSGLKTGLLLYNTKTKTTNFISKGVDATFSDDGKKIVFAKVYDDGENYTDSEIFIYDIESKKVKQIIGKDAHIKRFPYLKNNTLYLNIDFNIYELNLDKE
jgi:hypothetical protein